MKQIIFALAFLASVQTLSAQNILIDSANEYAAAFAKRDFDKVIDLTLPKIVDMGGGKELMVKDLHDERLQVVKNGMDYISASVGAPGEIFTANGDQQLVIPVTYKIVSNLSELDLEAKLLAVSKDDGKSWYFLDVAKYDKESLKSFYTNLSEEIQF